MLGPIAAMTFAAEIATAGQPVAPCMLEAVAVDRATILAEGMDAVPEPAFRAAAAACGLVGDDIDNAEFPFSYYVGSLAAAQRLTGKWSPDRLASVVDAIPGDEIEYFWMGAPSQKTDAYRRQEAAAWSKVYQALGAPPARVGEAFRGGDLEQYIIARVGWRIGEMELAQPSKGHAGQP
jgi:hypothetical protein